MKSKYFNILIVSIIFFSAQILADEKYDSKDTNSTSYAAAKKKAKHAAKRKPEPPDAPLPTGWRPKPGSK